jgi:hypothetical protein
MIETFKRGIISTECVHIRKKIQFIQFIEQRIQSACKHATLRKHLATNYLYGLQRKGDQQSKNRATN